MSLPYEWRAEPHTTPPIDRFVGTRSGYAVGFVFPSNKEVGRWVWSAEHAASGAQAEDKEDTKEEAKAALERWFSEQVRKRR